MDGRTSIGIDAEPRRDGVPHLPVFGVAAVLAAGVYLVLAGLAMQRATYDVWGAILLAPALVGLSILLARQFFGDRYDLLPAVVIGLFAKLGGALLIYTVTFSAYGRGDSNSYHTAGSELAGAVRDGTASFTTLIPRDLGTPFIEQLTGLIYFFVGSSKLAGFFLFATMSFWGLAFFVKAAVIAVPELDPRRYALMVFLLPSLFFWSSTIGKEAFVMLCLGLASLGLARLLTAARTVPSVLMVVGGLVGTSFVRPHMGAIWTGAFAVALVASLFVRRSEGMGGRLRLAVLAGIALIGLGVAASVTLEYLDPSVAEETSDVAEQVILIAERVEEQTAVGGSAISPLDVDGPQDWPYAAVRTLTRPLPSEARSLAELLPGIEMMVLLASAAFGWRRIANLPRQLVRSPYVLYVVVCLFVFGVAFSSVNNLGILVRQRSLALPLLLLPLCLKPRSGAVRRHGPTAEPSPADELAVSAGRR